MMQRVIDTVKRNLPLTVMAVIAVALLVGSVVTYMQYQSAQTGLDKAQKEAIVAKANLAAARDQYDVDKLRAQEAALKATPDIPSKWPSELPIINLSELISRGAAKYYVTINSVTPSMSAVTIEGRNYSAYRALLNVTSVNLWGIIAFISYVENGPFTSLKTEGLSLALDATGLKWQGQFTVVVVSGT